MSHIHVQFNCYSNLFESTCTSTVRTKTEDRRTRLAEVPAARMQNQSILIADSCRFSNCFLEFFHILSHVLAKCCKDSVNSADTVDQIKWVLVSHLQYPTIDNSFYVRLQSPSSKWRNLGYSRHLGNSLRWGIHCTASHKLHIFEIIWDCQRPRWALFQLHLSHLRGGLKVEKGPKMAEVAVESCWAMLSHVMMSDVESERPCKFGDSPWFLHR